MVCQERFMLNTRKNFFTETVVKLWNRLPRELVAPPLLEVFKRFVGVSLKDIVNSGLGRVRLTVGLNNLKGLFQDSFF